MPVILRDYQSRAVNDVMRHWRDRTATNVCLTSPTGSGKTVIGEEFVNRAHRVKARVLWICHRDSLVRQAEEELERRHMGSIGCIHPDFQYKPDKLIQVATVQSMLARGVFPDAKMVVLDECHHFAASEWRRVAEHYRNVRTVGLTATPERSDGRPLGDIFEKMVVAENYSGLIRRGHILDCRLVNPPRDMPGGLAQDPVAAYQRWGENKYGFVFCSTVQQAHELTQQFNAAGIGARAIVSETDTSERDRSLKLLNAGSVRLLVNVYCLTEGVNVPRAKICMLARGTGSVLTYLQMVGRCLRPFRDEKQALLLDLHGSSLAHGFPTEDRVFSLEGNGGISRTANADALRQCLNCGFVWRSTQGPQCPECGWTAPPKVKPVRIYNEELREVFKGDDTPADAQEKELVRLKMVAAANNYSTGWVVREYRQLFKNTPIPMDLFTPDELEQYQQSLLTVAKKKGYNQGWARGLFKRSFGSFFKRH